MSFENRGQDDALQVVYIMGFGRSGSTLLDLLLGQSPAIVAVGELGALSRRVWEHDEFCSCGQPVQSCDFWHEAVQRWRAHPAFVSFEEYRRLQDRFESLSAILDHQWRRLPARADFKAYGEQTQALLQAVAAVGGRRVIVDSSKLPGRSLALSLIPEIRLRAIHLVRDGRGVAWSLSKPYKVDRAAGIERPLPRRPVTRTALRWSAVNAASEWVGRGLDPADRMRLRYEDLVADPGRALGEIGAMIGVDLDSVVTKLQAGQPITAKHEVAGNRLRMKGGVSLRTDQEWLAKMPSRQQRLFQWLCQPLQRRYGYF